MVLILVISITMITYSITKANADGIVPAPVIQTDKTDYSPSETVIITGSNFVPVQLYAIPVIRPDGTIVTGDGSFTQGWDNITADENGAFTYNYMLDGITGTYEARVYPSTWTGDLEEIPLAATTFTDTKPFTVTITPTSAYAGETKTYTINITNLTHGSNIGSATVSIPTGFTSVSITSWIPPAGKTWNATVVSGQIKLAALANGESDKLDENESILVSFSAKAPSTTGAYVWTTTAYSNNNWTGGTFDLQGTQPTVTVTLVSITITSSPTGANFVKVDTAAITTPQTFSWVVGTTHSLDALSPVSGGTGKQYVWTNWTAPSFGSSTSQTYTYTVPSSTETVTANYKTQFRITVSSAHDSPTASAWVDSGGSFTASVTSPADIVSGDHQWVCTGYKLDGGSLTSGTSYAFTNVLSAHTIEFDWKEQFWIAVSSAHDSPTASDWVDQGTGLTVGVTSPANDNGMGTRYRCTGYTLDSNPPVTDGSTSYTFIDVQSAQTIVFNWIAQYRLTVSSAHDSPAPIVGDHWYDTGTHIDASVTTPADDDGAGTRYRCTGYSGTGSVGFGSGASVGFDIAAPSTLTWNWIAQYYLTVNTSPASIDSPTGAGWYDTGVTAHVSTAQYDDIVSGSSRYRFDSWTGASGTYSDATVTMDSAKTATANYKTQYYVTFAQSGVGTDFSGNVMTVGGVDYNRTGHSDWYNSGASIAYSYASPLSVDAGKRYFKTSTDAPPLVVSAATTVTGTYKTQWYIVVTSAHGGPTESSQWVNDGVAFSVSVTDPDVVVALEHRWVLTGLTVDGSPQSVSDTVSYAAVHASHTIVFSWTEQWYIVVTSAHDAPTLSAWVDQGIDFTASVTSPTEIVANDNQWVCTGFKVDGGVLTAGTTHTFSGVTAKHTIEFDWKQQFYLTVNTSPASVNSPTGAGWYDTGVTAHVSTAQYDPIATGSRYRFDSWTGASGTYSDATVVMDAAKTATANYIVQYKLTVSTSPAVSPMPVVTFVSGYDSGGGWYDTGSVVKIDPNSPAGYTFDHWSGDAPGSTVPLSVTMTSAKTIVAVYAFNLAVETGFKPGDSPSFASDPYLTQIMCVLVKATGGYKLAGTSPGTFDYAIAIKNTGTTTFNSIIITVNGSSDFSLQSSNPIRVLDANGNVITSQFTISGTWPNIAISSNGLFTGLQGSKSLYVTIHLDYALKGNSGFSQFITKGYTFHTTVTGTSAPNSGTNDLYGSVTFLSKKTTIIYGYVKTASGTPIVGAKIELKAPDGTIYTDTTDADGFFCFINGVNGENINPVSLSGGKTYKLTVTLPGSTVLTPITATAQTDMAVQVNFTKS